MTILYYIPYPEGYGDDRFIYDGFRHAFADLGHELVPLTERDTLEDKLAAVHPDILVLSIDVPRFDFAAQAPVIKRFRDGGGKVFMRVGIFDEEKRTGPYADILRLAREGSLADAYYSENTVPKEFFEDLTGHPCRMLPLAADRTIHFPAKPSPKYECDVIYIGANLPMKQEIFKRRLYPLMKRYDVKVFGGDWDALDRYVFHPLAKVDRKLNLGGIFSRMRIKRQVPLGEENVAYSSAKISLNFHERYRDITFLNARGFKIPASGGFEICDPNPMLREYFTADEMAMPETDDEFFRTVDHYLTHEAERKAMQERATAKALKEHTWHNRAKTMLAWYNSLH